MSQGLDERWIAVRRLAVAILSSIVVVLGCGPAAAQSVELLMFEEPGCPWCRRWHGEVGPGYARSAEGRRAPLRTVQIDAQPVTGIRLASPVRLSPTFVLVEDGREVGRILGYPGADFFWPMLEELLAKLKPRGAVGTDAASTRVMAQAAGSAR